MKKTILSTKQIRDYQTLCRQRASGELLTPASLRLICQSLRYDPKAIGTYFLGKIVEYDARGIGMKDECMPAPDDAPLDGQMTFDELEPKCPCLPDPDVGSLDGQIGFGEIKATKTIRIAL